MKLSKNRYIEDCRVTLHVLDKVLDHFLTCYQLLTLDGFRSNWLIKIQELAGTDVNCQDGREKLDNPAFERSSCISCLRLAGKKTSKNSNTLPKVTTIFTITNRSPKLIYRLHTVR